MKTTFLPIPFSKNKTSHDDDIFQIIRKKKKINKHAFICIFKKRISK